MSEQTTPTADENDMALISFARVVLDLLYATDLVRPSDIDPLLEFHEKEMEEMKYAKAAGILGVIRQLSNDPRREQMREGLRKLIQGRARGSA